MISTLTRHKAGPVLRQTRGVPASAPRYDERVLEAARRLDDEQQPIAEICRRVGETCDRLGLTRPSYVHLRRFIRAEREKRHAVEAMRRELVGQVLAGRAPLSGAVQTGAREAKARADLRRRS